MPTSAVEEYFYELVRGVGDAYNLINGGSGNSVTPGTALFEIAQMQSIAKTNLPYFGIIDIPNSFKVEPTKADPSGVSPTADDLKSRRVKVARGQVAYNGQTINVPQQTVPIAKDFVLTYAEPDEAESNRYYYGVLLGLPLKELQNTSKVFNTVTLDVAVTTQNYIRVLDIQTPFNLGFPLKAVVNNTVLEFSDCDLDNGYLYISPSFASIDGNTVSYGVVGVNIPAQSRVTFIYEPRIKTRIDAPYKGTPDVDAYNPEVPADWLPIAKLLVADPNHPRLIETNNYQIKDIQFLYSSTPNLTQAEKEKLLNDCETLKKTIIESKGYTSVSGLLESMIQYTGTLSDTNTNFVSYWASRPFKTKAYYAPGVSFDNLQRFEFPVAFSKAYYSMLRQDTMHTFGIFRGDMITKLQQDSSATPPANITVQSYAVPSSSLTKGTIIYNVSAIDEAGLEGEAVTMVAQPSVGSNVYIVNELDWDTSANTKYHVYRRSNVVGNISEARLSPNGGFSYIEKPAIVSCTPDANHTISNNLVLIKVVSSGSLLGGIKLNLKPVDATALATLLQLSGGIKAFYWGTSTSSLNVPTEGYASSTFAFGDFNTNPSLNTECFLTFNRHHDLAAGTHYIGVYIPDTALDLIKIRTQSTGGNDVFYESLALTYAEDLDGNVDYSAPQTVDTFVAQTGSIDVQVYGFLDHGQSGTFVSSRGVEITGRVSNAPSRLCLHVPPLQIDNDLIGTPIALDGLTTNTTATALTNDLYVLVYARNTVTGKTGVLSGSLPRGTVRGTKVILGTTADLYDTIDYMYVQVGSNFNKTSDNQVRWTTSDLITVENVTS